MNLHFTEEQRMMLKKVREFAKSEVEPFVEKMEKGIFPRVLLQKMGALGLMGIPIPERYEGAGKDFTSYIIAIHEISKISATLGVILSVHTSVGTLPILTFGTEPQKKKYVTKLAKGEKLGAFCLTEPSSGSDAASMKTRAVKKDDYYLLNGSKIFITNGGEADTYIVFAKTGSTEISAFIVDNNTPGLIIGKDERKMGLNGSRTVQLLFEDAKVPIENLLGEEGKGFKIAMANLDGGRIGIAAQALGIAEAALEQATSFIKAERQVEKPTASGQVMQLKLADMATNVNVAELLVYQAAYRKEHNLPCGKQAAMAKLFASKIAMEVTTEAVQIFGGLGFTKDFPVERYFRDAKVCEIYEGTSEIQRIVISKHLLKEK
ncbi:acyl-CoA dehydrogenase [Metabacillus rhizolycopersici]|uniref:Acyl-CoA dehydrogenase n=1 Tax=Metabacillus rhizolycopersici TaxID=2875709 RepID=A0ABS7ULR5_9BACI|nr:acyl-CoA dehydrogenase [Metabacillus rhizolycopersici]MBZ5749149.1 acyl-CoA dehydrogenase [Metabacillus rhizolycopersici]